MPEEKRGSTKQGASDSPIVLPSNLSRQVQDLSRDQHLVKMPKVRVDRTNVPFVAGIVLLGELGQGSMGAVYWGYDPERREEVAVKLIKVLLTEDSDEIVKRFQREAKMAMMVSSPNLVRVHALTEEKGILVMVMEYIQGRNCGELLDEVIAEHRPQVSEVDALAMCAAASMGLGALHENGIVHRDVKPDNIFIPSKDAGVPDYAASKIGDLGIGRSESFRTALTQTSIFMGSPGFMAPEQAESCSDARAPADVFAMGATLYCLLTTRPPFVGRTPIATILKTVEENHEPISNYREDLSAATVEVIDRCLEKHYDDRYANGYALAEALNECVAKLGD